MQAPTFRRLAALGILVLAACDGGRVRDPITGVLTFDAATLPNADGGPDGARSPSADAGGLPDAGPVGVSADGVLTNRPDILFVNTGALDMVLVTAAFRMMERSDGWALFWAGDYENRGTRTYCLPDIDARMNGVDVLTVADGPMYLIPDSTGGGSRYQCLGPGERSVFWGVQTDLWSTFLDGVTVVYYRPSALVRNEAYADPARPPLLASMIVRTEAGEWQAQTRFRTTSVPIYNFSVSVMPRIGGLLWHEMAGYHLDDVPPWTEFEPVTYGGYSDRFVEFEASMRYLVRRLSSAVDPNDETFLAHSAWRSRRAAARRALHGED